MYSVYDLIIRLEDDEEDVVKRIDVVTWTESDHLPVKFKVTGGEGRSEVRAWRGKSVAKGVQLVWEWRDEETFGEELNKVWRGEEERNRG